MLSILSYQAKIATYETQLDDILEKFQNKYEEKTEEKLNIVLERVEVALEKNSFKIK